MTIAPPQSHCIIYSRHFFADSETPKNILSVFADRTFSLQSYLPHQKAHICHVLCISSKSSDVVLLLCALCCLLFKPLFPSTMHLLLKSIFRFQIYRSLILSFEFILWQISECALSMRAFLNAFGKMMLVCMQLFRSFLGIQRG